MKIPKKANIVYKQMPAPREPFQQISTPGQKLGWKCPRMGDKFLVKIPGGVRGMVIAKVDIFIIGTYRPWMNQAGWSSETTIKRNYSGYKSDRDVHVSISQALGNPS